MKLKGNYSGDVSYSIGDVVLDFDGVVYILYKEAKAGTDPKDAHYWGRLQQPLDDVVRMIMDGLGSANIPTNISDSAIVLNSSTPDSDKQFIITVDDDGDITATELTEEAEEDGE